MDAVRKPSLRFSTGSALSGIKQGFRSEIQGGRNANFVTWLLAFGMIVSPAMAELTETGDAKNATAFQPQLTVPPLRDKEEGWRHHDACSQKTECGKAGRLRAWDESELISNSGISSRLIQAAASAKRTTEGTAAENASAGERSQLQQRPRGLRSHHQQYGSDGHTAGVASTPVGGMPTGTGNGSPQLGNETPAAIHFKGITITPGGFLAAETVFRNKAMGADINTPSTASRSPATREPDNGIQRQRTSVPAQHASRGQTRKRKAHGLRRDRTSSARVLLRTTMRVTATYFVYAKDGAKPSSDNGWSVTGRPDVELGHRNKEGP